MSTRVRWVADRERAGRQRGRLASLGATLGTIGLGLALLLAVLLVVPGRLPADRPVLAALTAGAGELSPAELTDLAADLLDGRTAAGGGGYRFEIVQTSTMVARPGGPRIPVPDPVTRGTARLADRYYLHALIEQGVVRPDGFWSEMRAGPAEGKAPDWTGSEVMFEALVRDGTRSRNDGAGWYESDGLPGIGLDPETAALLPALLRAAADATDVPAGDPKADPDAARTLEAEATVAAIPGIVAADGASFTNLTGPLVYGFDATGRVVSVTVTAQNMNMVDFELVIATTITIAYDGVDELPEAKPARSAEGSN